MSDQDRRPTDVQTPIVPPATAARHGRLPLIVAGLLVVVLAVGYFAVGLPVLRAPDEARAPKPPIDATLQQPPPGAPAAPATPTQPRP
ncbi:MAG: hypothetical protein FD144_3102 [Rhodospirillaceae bacterium]|nr:MAG: hypothetical protein FD144_3102 [Rhodospirillaceae bacterium]